MNLLASLANNTRPSKIYASFRKIQPPSVPSIPAQDSFDRYIANREPDRLISYLDAGTHSKQTLLWFPWLRWEVSLSEWRF